MIIILIALFLTSCEERKVEEFEVNSSFFVVSQINPSHSNNPYVCEYRLEVFNPSDGPASFNNVDGNLGVYDTIGKFQINDTIYFKSNLQKKKIYYGPEN